MLLTHSPADVVRHLLVSAGYGVLRSVSQSSAWPIFTGNESDSPNNAISVFDTQGRKLVHRQVDGQATEHYGIQVLVRAETYPVGWTKANAIAKAFDEDMYDETVHIGASTYLVHSVARVGGVLAVGKDSTDSKRSLFSINALATLHMQ